MSTNEELIRQALVDFADGNQSTDYSFIDKSVRAILDDLAKQDVITFSDECNLDGVYLERRVRLSLEKMGFDIREGRPRKEDLVCSPPKERPESHPLVWEIKSGGNPYATTKHLRQLDDWVFDLSGESARRIQSIEVPRKQPGTTQFYPFGGWISPYNTVPVKGVLLYNGYIGEPAVPFTSRPVRVSLDANEKQFALSRGFCALTFEALLTWERAILDGHRTSLEFWDKLQETLGEVEPCDPPK